MLNLQPLIARLVEDILRAIGETTLAELEAVANHTEAVGVRPATTNGRDAHGKGTARAPKPPLHVGSRSRARAARLRGATDSTTPEPVSLDEITDPDQLLTPALLPVSIERTLSQPSAVEKSTRSEPEESPPTGGPHAGNHRTPLRAGESVARVSAAGVVIRRAKRA